MKMYILPDAVWSELRTLLLEAGAYATENLRKHVEGIIWRIKNGATWRAVPACFGSWSTIFNLFNAWSKKGIWQKIFERLQAMFPDTLVVSMDSTSIKAQKSAFGGPGGRAAQGLGW